LLDANSELLAEVGDFIKQSTELQKWGHCRSKVWHVKNIILINRIYFVYPILWSNCNFLCFLCFVCLYLYLLDPHGCIIMQIKNIHWYAHIPSVYLIRVFKYSVRAHRPDVKWHLYILPGDFLCGPKLITQY
jgi:hypothetical protein